jgi:WD40 repeat protein
LALKCFRDRPAPGSVVVYRRRDGKFIKFRDLELKDGEGLNSLSPDGNFLILKAGDSKEHRERLVSVVSGKEADQGLFSGDMVVKTIFSPNSKLVAVQYIKESSETGVATRIEVLRLSDRKKLAEVQGSGLIFDFDFSPDGRYVAAAALDGKLAIIDLHANKSVAAEFNFIGGALEVAFDQHSRLLAVITAGAIRVIDLATTREIAEIPVEESMGHLAFSYDGKYLAVAVDVNGSGDLNYLVRVWLLSPEALLNEATTRLNHIER